LSPGELGTCMATGAIVLLLVEAEKFVRRRMAASGESGAAAR